MLTELDINNFRSVRSLKMSGLGQINIFGGRNGSGKSTVLEAVELFLAPEPLRPAQQIVRRGLEVLPSQNTAQATAVEAPWETLFPDFASETGARIFGTWKGTDTWVSFETRISANETQHLNLLARNPSYLYSLQQWISEERILRIRATGNPSPLETLVHPVPDGTWGWTAPIHPMAPCVSVWASGGAGLNDLADLFSVVLQARKEDLILDVMKAIVPGLKKIIPLSKNNRSRLYADTGGSRLLPVSLLGDGALRVLRILVAGLSDQGGIWIVDEIENGIHYSFLKTFWEGLAEACRINDRQLICTTHSFEHVRVASETLGHREQFRPHYFRVDRGPDGHTVVPYHQDVLEIATREEIEIRD
jgi:energy-coupling factor transporter ATP-binding protein EcfA2